MRSTDDLFSKCERDGEEAVRNRMAENVYCTKDERPIIQEWLRRKDEVRSLAASSKRDAREEETLSIAKEANRIASDALIVARSSSKSARKQARWAMWAAIIATTAIIIAAMAYIKTP